MEKDQKSHKKQTGAKAKSQQQKNEAPTAMDGKRNTKGQTQYPPKVGYHGTDDEKELSPEE